MKYLILHSLGKNPRTSTQNTFKTPFKHTHRSRFSRYTRGRVRAWLLPGYP